MRHHVFAHRTLASITLSLGAAFAAAAFAGCTSDDNAGAPTSDAGGLDVTTPGFDANVADANGKQRRGRGRRGRRCPGLHAAPPASGLHHGRRVPRHRRDADRRRRRARPGHGARRERRPDVRLFAGRRERRRQRLLRPLGRVRRRVHDAAPRRHDPRRRRSRREHRVRPEHEGGRHRLRPRRHRQQLDEQLRRGVARDDEGARRVVHAPAAHDRIDRLRRVGRREHRDGGRHDRRRDVARAVRRTGRLPERGLARDEHVDAERAAGEHAQPRVRRRPRRRIARPRRLRRLRRRRRAALLHLRSGPVQRQRRSPTTTTCSPASSIRSTTRRW